LRVFDAHADIHQKPITEQEKWYATLLILHLNNAYWAMKEGMFLQPEGLQKDIRWFFSLPITKEVWEKTKPFQDKEVVSFIEKCLSDA
jgi:hypothetical protein